MKLPEEVVNKYGFVPYKEKSSKVLMQTYSVDVNDPSELRRLISKLQKRRKLVLREMGINMLQLCGSKINAQQIMPLLESIWETDLSFLYENCAVDKKFYVYAHCDKREVINIQKDVRLLFMASKFPQLKHPPFYIGKGTGGRIDVPERSGTHRKLCTAIGDNWEAVKLFENLTESEAFSIESKLIDILGLRSISNFGMLVNLDEGKSFRERRNKYPEHPYLKKYLKKVGLTL